MTAMTSGPEFLGILLAGIILGLPLGAWVLREWQLATARRRVLRMLRPERRLRIVDAGRGGRLVTHFADPGGQTTTGRLRRGGDVPYLPQYWPLVDNGDTEATP